MLTLKEFEQLAEKKSLAMLLKAAAESSRDWERRHGHEAVCPKAAAHFQTEICLILSRAIKKREREVGHVRLAQEFDILFQAADERGLLGTPGLNTNECVELINSLPLWILRQLRACRPKEDLTASDLLNEHELGSYSERGDVPSTYDAAKSFLRSILEDIKIGFTRSHLDFREDNQQAALDVRRYDKRLTLELEVDKREYYSLTLTLERLDREYLELLPYPPALSRQMCEVSFQVSEGKINPQWKIMLVDMSEWKATDESTWLGLSASLIRQFDRAN